MYQKLIQDAWTRKRKKRVNLPIVVVNFSQPEDSEAPEVTVEIEGCSIPKVPIDGGLGVNLMLQDTAFDLGFTAFEATEQILRMADQSRVNPVGKLLHVPTRIGGQDYLLNYMIIHVHKGRPFPMLLGRPWLYDARVLVDWGAKELVVGKPSVRIPWAIEKHLGEISDSDGYTTDWSDPKDSATSYYIDPFKYQSESNYGFSNAVLEHVPEEILEPFLEDLSLGESSVPLTSEWITEQIRTRNLPTGGSETKGSDWGALASFPEEVYPEKVKPVVSPTDYVKENVEPDRSFYLNKLLKDTEKSGYVQLLRVYLDIFAWEPSDLKGIHLI